MGPGDAFNSLFISQDGIFEYFFVGFPTETIEQLCAQIENAVEELGVPLSDEIIKQFFTKVLGEGFSAEIDTLIECLLKEGIIVDREFPDSISNNPITTQSNNPITTQSTNALPTTTTTQSSNIGAPQSSNVLPQSNNAIPTTTTTQPNNAITPFTTGTPTTQSNTPITTQSNTPITTQSNTPITTQSNNPITTTTTTQSSNTGVPASSNIGAAALSTFSSSPSSTLVNILPSNPN